MPTSSAGEWRARRLLRLAVLDAWDIVAAAEKGNGRGGAVTQAVTVAPPPSEDRMTACNAHRLVMSSVLPTPRPPSLSLPLLQHSGGHSTGLCALDCEPPPARLLPVRCHHQLPIPGLGALLAPLWPGVAGADAATPCWCRAPLFHAAHYLHATAAARGPCRMNLFADWPPKPTHVMGTVSRAELCYATCPTL